MAKFFWSVYVVASVLLGVFVGHLFFRAFDAVVPPAVVTSFNRAAAYSSFLFYGAVLGGLLLGLIEVLVSGFVEGGSQYRDGVAFVILIAVLLVKPSGLLGRSTHEKV